MATKGSAESLAAEFAEAICNGKDHARLNWRKKGTVALTGDSVPDGFKQQAEEFQGRYALALPVTGSTWMV